jgi:DNA-binding transcriptional ArsR family regulator
MAPRPAKTGAGGRAAKAGAKKAPRGEKSRKAAERRRKPDNAADREASFSFLLSHPVRVQILAAAHRQPISPSGFARAHDLEAHQVAEHFRRLEEYGAIKLLRIEDGPRGSRRKVYVGVKRGIISAKEWHTLDDSVQKELATAGLQDFIVVSAQAIHTGSFSRRKNFVFTWDEPTLDPIAWRKLAKMCSLLWAKIPALEEESEMRQGADGPALFKAVVGLAAFEAPEPIDTGD